MHKSFAAASIAIGSASAISLKKVWTTISLSPKAADDYTDAPKAKEFSRVRQHNNIWRLYRPWLKKYKGKWNHGKWVRAEDRLNQGYQGDPSRGYGPGLTKRYSWQDARGYGDLGGPETLYGVLEARHRDGPYVSYSYR